VSERFWDRVLHRLEAKTVVPILGPDLLTIDDTPLYRLLATKLASHLNVPSEDLPVGSELAEVSRRYLARSRDVQEIYRSVRMIFREIEPLPIPVPLLSLARIPELQLFVTTTFDVLVERAVDHERFQGQRQTLAFAYAPTDRQDLPPEFDRLGRPGVFHLLGRLSGTPHSFAVTREDTLEFMDSLQTRPPGFLFDKLRESDLLILGSPLGAWLARLLAPISPDEEAPVLFVERATAATERAPVESAVAFVRELERRCAEMASQGEHEPAVPSGAVYLSAVEADRGAAESIRDLLDRAGIDVVLDLDDTPLAAFREKRLRGAVGICSVFVPLVSAASTRAKRRFLRSEWVEAILEAAASAPSGRFLLPVALGELPPGGGAVPAEFGELSWEKLPESKPSSEFVKTLVEIQRGYRRAKSA
jgi:hypothetical protein